jgi:hypothetical protein
MDKVIKFTTSKGREAIELDGFTYRRDRTSKSSLYWRCLIDGCHGRLRTNLEYENPQLTQDHHHLPDRATTLIQLMNF